MSAVIAAIVQASRRQKNEHVTDGNHDLQKMALDRQLSKGFPEDAFEEDLLMDPHREAWNVMPNRKMGQRVGKGNRLNRNGIEDEMKALDHDMDDFEARLFGGDDDGLAPPAAAQQEQAKPKRRSAPATAVYARVEPGIAVAHNFVETKIEVPIVQQQQQQQQYHPSPQPTTADSFVSPAINDYSGKQQYSQPLTDDSHAWVPQPPPPVFKGANMQMVYAEKVSDLPLESLIATDPATDDMFARPLNSESMTSTVNNDVSFDGTSEGWDDDDDDVCEADLVEDLERLRMDPSFGSIESLKECARIARKLERQRRMQQGISHYPPLYQSTTFQQQQDPQQYSQQQQQQQYPQQQYSQQQQQQGNYYTETETYYSF